MNSPDDGQQFMTHDFSASRELGQEAHERYRRSVTITIHLPALRQNMALARKLSGGSRQFATIKADAYGHGAVAVAHALSPRASKRQYSDPTSDSNEPTDSMADGFAVVTLEEALELRQSGIRQPVLVLQGPQEPDAVVQMKRHQLWPVIHDHTQYGWFRTHADCSTLQAWLKVDSGMGRLGFQPDEASRILASDDGVVWSGLMTHFACADETANPYTKQQVQRFGSVQTERVIERSLANSAAILGWPITRADWARPGIMLYGCNPLDRALDDGVGLATAMTVHAPLISIKRMSQGAGIGYAQTWRCPEDMPIGYVAAGYRDGIPRVLNGSARVFIGGHHCPIVGRVSMDSFAVDLRRVPDAKVGQAVELWGENNSVDELAQAAGTISYELLTSIRGKRVYTHG